MAKAGKTSTIKYSDKSEGQPELLSVFMDVKKVMEPFAKGSYVVKDEMPANFSIYYNKPVTTAGLEYPELPFAALLIQKGYVGFYFFPVYTDPSLKTQLAPEVAKMLKGKSCFHLKNSEPQLLRHLTEAMHAGKKLYESKGWK